MRMVIGTMHNVVGMITPERIKIEEIPRLDKALIDEYKKLTDHAGIVARAMDQLGISNTIPAVDLQVSKAHGLAIGQSITVRNIPEKGVPYKRWIEGEGTHLGERESYFLAQEGDIIAIDGSSVYPASCLGSMSTRLAHKMGIAGIIVNGCVTGLSGIKKAEIPVWSRGGTTITGHQRVETIEINSSIGLFGTRVDPGDLIVADESGVSVVPFHYAQEVLDRAKVLLSLGGKIKELMESEGNPSEFKKALKNQMSGMSETSKKG